MQVNGFLSEVSHASYSGKTKNTLEKGRGERINRESDGNKNGSNKYSIEKQKNRYKNGMRRHVEV